MTANVILSEQLFDSVAQLTAKEQARALQFISTFRDNPANPGLKLERVIRARSDDVWAARISGGLRAILYKDGDTWAILHAGQHDPAYDWAERRMIGRHSVTGAIQIVDAVETIEEVQQFVELPEAQEDPLVFEGHDDAYLLSLGLPETWLPTLRRRSRRRSASDRVREAPRRRRGAPLLRRSRRVRDTATSGPTRASSARSSRHAAPLLRGGEQ